MVHPVDFASLPSSAETDAADAVAGSAAQRAGVRLETIIDFDDMLAVSALLESVWGRSDEGVPMNADVLRAIVHAGGCVTCAYDEQDSLVGAAALMPSVPSTVSYSMIAAAREGGRNAGVGWAIKMHQRSWALRHGFTTMAWTFDPLLSRNARFNLVKLGAQAEEYEVAFYGHPTDAISGSDEADRLVVNWDLGSYKVLAACTAVLDGQQGEATISPPTQATLSRVGPDGAAVFARLGLERWCRVPSDIIALRRSDPDQASWWRMAMRSIFVEAFSDGLCARSMSRDGWYRLSPKASR